jgi:predicted enzyme related to lactoylglutathione lyase
MKPNKCAALTAALFLLANGPSAPEPANTPPVSAQITLMSVTFEVADIDRAVAFYTKGLGLVAGARMDRSDVTELPLSFSGGSAGILLVSPKTARTLAASSCGGRAIMSVPDLPSLKTRLEAAGYALRGPIMDVPQYHVRVGNVQDPDGNELELVQMQI